MNGLGTEIRLFTKEPNFSSIKIKVLEDEKGTIKKGFVYISQSLLNDFDTLNFCQQIHTELILNIGKKIKKSNQIYQFIQEKISNNFVSNFEITHLKIHPLLQVIKGGKNYIRFDEDVKEAYLLEPIRRFQKQTKGE